MTPEEIEKAVVDVIEAARTEPGHHSIKGDRDEVYAYRHGEAVHYGHNGGKFGFAVFQGIWYGINHPENKRWKTGNPGT